MAKGAEEVHGVCHDGLGGQLGHRHTDRDGIEARKGVGALDGVAQGAWVTKTGGAGVSQIHEFGDKEASGDGGRSPHL